MTDIRKLRGYTKELEVVKKLSRRKGLYAFRIPTSGSPMLPDVIAVDSYSKTIYAIEVKSSTRRRVEVKRHQIVRLLHFLRAFRALARECVAAVALYSYRSKRWTVYEVTPVAPQYSTASFILNEESWEIEQGHEFLNRGIHAQKLEELLNLTRARRQA